MTTSNEPRSFLKYRKAFEESVGATLALDLSKNEQQYYTSAKTANLFIAFCYGWEKGGGDTRSLAAFRADLAPEVPHGGI